MAEYLVHNTVIINVPDDPMKAFGNLTPTAKNILSEAVSPDLAQVLSTNPDIQKQAIQRLFER